MKDIILVDDRYENRYMLESLLKNAEYKIRTANNGVEALSLARESHTDLIITDLLMPVMDGFTLCKEWHKDAELKNTPFIFYTAAYTSPQDIKYALRLGADRFLIIPLDPAQFLSAVSEVLEASPKGRVKSIPESDKNEAETLREYNTVLFHKLEDKLVQAELNDSRLQQYASELEQNLQKLRLQEENLRQTRDYLDNLINYANAPIIVWDPGFTIMRFNHAFERLTGFSADEVVGQKLDMLLPSAIREESLARIKKTLNRRHWESVEIPVLTKSNKTRIILWNSALIYDSEGKQVISAIAQGQDITERKRAEVALKTSEAKLQELNATKDKLFSIIGHDLKSPLNAILGFSSQLKDESNRLDPETIREYAGYIYTSTTQVFRLLDNLLNWARVQSGQLSYNPTLLTLKAVAKEVIELLDENAKNKSITLEDNIPEELKVTADSDMLKTVVRNLVSNAIKFTPQNGKVEIDAVEHDSQVEISVKDNGKGIRKDKLDNLFNLDYSFTTPGTAGETGTGLGLTLIREFIEKHRGSIWAESEEGKGSAFYFTLPSYNHPAQKYPYKRRSRQVKQHITQRA